LEQRGKALAAASEDNTVMVWNLDLDDLLNKSCNWLRDYLQNNPKVRPSDRNLCEGSRRQNESEVKKTLTLKHLQAQPLAEYEAYFPD
jgi:hypothetical protein